MNSKFYYTNYQLVTNDYTVYSNPWHLKQVCFMNKRNDAINQTIAEKKY